MKKIQNFTIFKISSERIRSSGYILELSYNDAIRNQEIVHISDSQLIRSIHQITNSKYNQKNYSELLSKRKYLSRKKNSKENRKELESVISEIEKLLHIEQIVSVFFSNKKHAEKIIKNGFILNGKKYSAFMASSGMIRRNTFLFISEETRGEVEKFFDNGRDLENEMVEVKFGVYYSLYSSSSLEVTFPRIAIVKDRIFKEVRNVEFAEIFGENKLGIDPKVSPKDVEIEFNSFDGQGLVSPKFAKIWSNDLELEYVPSAFIVRSSFLKGLCVTFDFHKFAKENSVNSFLDIYGKEINVKNVDVIISESQFKLWSSYKSTDDYLENCEKNNIGWGITRVSPREDKTHAFSSYQFIQSLDIEKEEKICKPTVDWLSSLGKTKVSILSYLLGEVDFSEGWFDRLDCSTQAILLENSLLEDSHFLKQIDKSISKKKKESCMGRLVFEGNYQFMIGDPYAQCSHIFGMPFKNILNEGECYSNFWNERNSDEIALVRSPNVHYSEINKLRLNKSKEVKDWYKYINSGIVFPPYGVSLDMAILGGSDLDGDIVFSTNYKPFIDGRRAGNPVFYKTLFPKKNKIKNKNEVFLKQSSGMGSKVGFLTNYGSAIASMLYDFDKDSKEYNLLSNRYFYIRVAQGLEIDKQKSILIPDFPSWWTKLDKQASDFEKSITVTKRPYFFRYLYEHMNKRYNDEFNAYDNISKTIYRVGLKELLSLEVPTKDQKNLIEEYKKKTFFIDNLSIMNRVSHYMESAIKGLSKDRFEISKNFDYKRIISKENYKPSKNDLEKIQLLFREYKSLKKALRENLQGYGEENYSNLDQIKNYINKRAYSTISSNSEELGNLVVYLCYKHLGETSRRFAWDCFGKEIVENIKNNKKEKFVRVPIKSKNGSFEYLFSKYGMFQMNID